MKHQLTILFFIAICLSFSSVFGQSTEVLTDSQETQDSVIAVEEVEEGVKFMHTERRESNPLQIQLVGTVASARPYTGAPGAGLHLGYQLSNVVYIGLTGSAFFDNRNQWDDAHSYEYDNSSNDDDDDDCCDSREVYGQDGVRKSESELDPIYLAEMRFTPWDFGLYFSLGGMYRGEQTSTITYKTKEREIGENTYTTGLEALVEYEAWSGLALGWGINHIFGNGLTLGTAFNIGLGRQEAEVTVSSTSAVSEADMEYWKKQIKSNEKQIPYICTLSIGYAF
ncbi:hypothetical protein KJ966_07105 [bacterium]|nr:hypothetical protein [bacterium]